MKSGIKLATVSKKEFIVNQYTMKNILKVRQNLMKVNSIKLSMMTEIQKKFKCQY